MANERPECRENLDECVEEQLREAGLDLSTLSADTQALLRDLQARRIELEIENEDLRAAYQQLESTLAERTVDLYSEIEDREQAEHVVCQEKQLLRIVLGAVSIGVIFADAQGNITYFSPSASAILDGPPTGTAAEPAPGSYRILRTDGAPFPPEELPLVRAVKSGQPVADVEMVIVRADGSAVHLLTNAVPTRDARGQVTGAVASLQDITERKRSEEALRDSESRFRSLFDHSPEAVFLTEPNGVIRAANPAACSMFGMTEEDIRRVGRAGLVDQQDPRFWAALRERARTGSIVNKEFGYIRKNGERFPGETSSVVLPGDASQSFVIVRDVTERKLAEEHQREALDRERHVTEILQNAIIPAEVSKALPGYHLAVRYRPALKEAEIGGDFYDVFELDDGRVGILIGDVAGKGLSAAIRVAAARYAFRSYAYVEQDPGRVMMLVNNALCREEGDEGNMLTAFFAVLDIQTGSLTYAGAGHEPPVLMRPDGSCEELEMVGIPLGLYSGSLYPQAERMLVPGDLVVMVTDGITEARAPGPELFGKERLIAFVKANSRQTPDEMASGILDVATVHAGGRLQDDAAIVVVSANGKE